MASVSGFTQDLFIRFQAGLVLAGFNEDAKLDAIASKYSKKPGRLLSNIKQANNEAKADVKEILASKDKDSEIYKFLKSLFGTLH